jgi:hypothetical protein
MEYKDILFLTYYFALQIGILVSNHFLKKCACSKWDTLVWDKGSNSKHFLKQ